MKPDEMREKIAEKLREIFKYLDKRGSRRIADQILSLFPQQETKPKEEVCSCGEPDFDPRKITGNFPCCANCGLPCKPLPPAKKEIEEIKGLTQDDMYFTNSREIGVMQAMDKLRLKQNEILNALNSLRRGE